MGDGPRWPLATPLASPRHRCLSQEAPTFPQKLSELGKDFILKVGPLAAWHAPLRPLAAHAAPSLALKALEKDPNERPTIVDMIK